MTTKQVLDSIYIIPALIDHFHNPCDETSKILMEAGITEPQIEELREIENLLTYHRDSVFSNFGGNYALLRKGLKEYWNKYLTTFWQKLGYTNKEKYLLDYGCGSGQVGDQFLMDNPNSSVLFVDKQGDQRKIKRIDFEEKPDWYIDFTGHFDLVLLSEVLHCKTKHWQNYLINSSYEMLNDNGELIVIENIDYAMQYRIHKIKKERTMLITFPVLKDLIGNRFTLKNAITIENHTAYVFRKIPGLL